MRRRGEEKELFFFSLHTWERGYPSTYLALFPAYLSLHQFLTARSKQSKTGGGEGLGMRLQPILLLPVLVVHVVSISYSHTPILTYSYTPIFHTLILPYSHTPILSYSHTPILPYSHTPILPCSYFHTLILPYWPCSPSRDTVTAMVSQWRAPSLLTPNTSCLVSGTSQAITDNDTSTLSPSFSALVSSHLP